MNAFNDSFVIALSWTLLHSLWQGGIIALVTGTILHFSKATKSSIRYNILCTALCLFIIGVIYTFYNMAFGSLSSSNLIDHSSAAIDSFNTYTSVAPFEVNGVGFSTLISQNIGIFFCIWLVFFSIKLFFFIKQVNQLTSMSSHGLSQLPLLWSKKINDLAKAMDLHKSFDVFQSTKVNVPSVVGMLKPIILLPLGLINQLPADQIEAILLHELAHIKRNDFLMNLVQRIVELFFFFNPGLIWLSTTLDNEREHCCDEMALAVHQDKKSFVNALVSFNELFLYQNNLALGFGTNKKFLLQRAKRILFNRTEGLARFDKTIMFICFMTTAIPSIQYLRDSPIALVSNYTPSEISSISLDSIPLQDTIKLRLEKEILMLSGQADSLKYTNTKNGEEQQKMIKIQLEKLTKLQSELNTLRKNELGNLSLKLNDDANILKIESTLLNLQKIELQAESKRLEELAIPLYVESTNLANDAILLNKYHETLADESKKRGIDSKKMEEDSKKMEEDSRRMEEESKQMEKESRQMEMESKRMEMESKRMEEDSKMMEKEAIYQGRQNAEIDRKASKIIEQLIQDKIITNKNDLSFSLSKEEMIVNRVKQHDTVAKKYFEAYGIKGGNIAHNFQYKTKKN